MPPGLGVVEGGEIPYLPAALEKRNANRADWMKLDPEVKCYMPGIPRATYMPYPFQIVQSADNILFTYEYASASRDRPLQHAGEEPGAGVDGMVGRPLGRRDARDRGDRSDGRDVVRSGRQPPQRRAEGDRALHGDRRHTLHYEATIEDPKTFSKPWTISMPLYRRREPNVQLMEYKCVEFTEELLYGHLRKK